MLITWSRLGLTAVASLAIAGGSQAQSLTTTFNSNNGQWGNMFNVLANAALTITNVDVHFEDTNNPAPACVGAGTCSVNEVELYYKTGGWVGFENNAAAWTLLGSTQHTITTPLGSGQPLALPINLSMDPAGSSGAVKYAFYITATGPVNTVTGGANEYMAYTNGSTVYTNTEMTIKNGIGMDYPFAGAPFRPREWNGTVYYTTGSGCSSNPVNYCTAGTSASGCQALISSSGTASATAGSGFTVSTTNMEGNKQGLFFYGQNGRQANPWGNGTSRQCVATPVKRGGLQAASGTAGQCDGGFSQDLNARWCAACTNPNHLPTAGTKMQIQCWYRDPQNTSNQTTSLSDALEVDICP